jgi:hypothetical protein
MRASSLLLAALALPLTLLGAPASQAAATTSKGQISVAQVIELVDRAKSDPAARMTVIAYLAGVGETTGILMAEAQQRGATPMSCSRSFTLDENVAATALTAAAPDQARWTETAATPIVIADLFARAGCR